MAWNCISDEQTDSPDYSSGSDASGEHSTKPTATSSVSLWFTVAERGSNCDGRGEQPGDRASGKFGRLLGAWRSDAFALSSQTVDGRGEEVWKTLWKFEDLWTPRGVFEEAGRTPASCWIVYKIRRSLLKWLKWLLSQHFNFPLFVPMIGGRCFGLQNWGNLS